LVEYGDAHLVDGGGVRGRHEVFGDGVVAGAAVVFDVASEAAGSVVLGDVAGDDHGWHAGSPCIRDAYTSES
jgi:hypothetical protein